MLTGMKSPVITNEIRWLVDPESGVTDFTAPEFFRRMEVPMPAAIGYSTIKSIHLPINAIVYAGSHHFTPTVPGKLMPYAQHTASFTEPMLLIQDLKTGRAIFTGSDGVDSVYGRADGTLFYYATAMDRSLHLDLTENINFAALGVGRSVLDDLLGEDTAQRLLNALGLSLSTTFVTKIPRNIAAVLHTCMPNHLTGRVGILYTQAKILEFLCELANWLKSLDEPAELNDTDRTLLLHLREELSGTAGNILTLSELSKKYGKSGRALNQGFKELFGCSIYTFVNDQRLTQAYEALVNTDAPMKTIAMNLGYTHVTNFMNAFRRKFGCPAGSLRK